MAIEQWTDEAHGLAPHCVGGGHIVPHAAGHRLTLPSNTGATYGVAQLDDYRALPRDAFPCRPPRRLRLRARFSHGQAELRGTAGFGWWNAPFEADRAATASVGPKALWFFFASPPSNLAVGTGWGGNGFFAQSLNTPDLPAWSMRWARRMMRLPFVARLMRMGGGAASRAAERPLPTLSLTEWHDYDIVWRHDAATFRVDGEVVLHVPSPPAGPLGLVLWIDNQWATVSGESGVLAVRHESWVEIEGLELES
ncbi:MAG: hypothetical protein KDD73_09875 [Anaerolineales bacterium]|nr:hypothetical protein [Anaerolineales bacterium]MCB9126667.1 hypothetical protein [Ardenticatenales bacterium]MCB9171793.1 hypothetical protein [Ardenticatenales bacterium]